MKRCTCCGTELLSDAAVCLKCGTVAEKTAHKQNKSFLDIFWFLISLGWPWFGIFLTIRFWKGDPYKAKLCLVGTILSLAIIGTILFVAFSAKLISLLGSIPLSLIFLGL